MSEHDHELPATCIERERNPAERAALERAAAGYRDSLRAETPAALGPTLRAAIAHRAARQSARAVWPLVAAAALCAALAVAAGLYVLVIEPAERRALTAEREAESERRAREHADLQRRLEHPLVRQGSGATDRAEPR